MTQTVAISSGFKSASLNLLLSKSPASYAARLTTAPKKTESIRYVFNFCQLLSSVFCDDLCGSGTV